MVDEVQRLAQAPGRVHVVGGEEPADALVEICEGEVHEHQAQEEIGHGEPTETREE